MDRRSNDLAPRMMRLGRRRHLISAAASVATLAALSADAAVVQGAPPLAGGGALPTIVATAKTTDVTLRAPRTVLSWSRFEVGEGELVNYRFQDRAGVVLNRVLSGPAVINGRINGFVGDSAGLGNVWFAAPGGVLFGGTARIDVGGLLATTATANVTDFLDPTQLGFSFSGGEAGIDLQAGAVLRANDGHIVLVAPDVTSAAGARVDGRGSASALYGAARTFTIRFAPVRGNLDLVDFIVPADGGMGSTPTLTLAGDTVAQNVLLATASRTGLARAVVNVTGVLVAQSATADSGDVVLSAGANIVGRRAVGIAAGADASPMVRASLVFASRDVQIALPTGGAADLDQISAGRDVIGSAGALSLGAVTSGRDIDVQTAGDLRLARLASAAGTGRFAAGGALVAGGGLGSVSALDSLELRAGTIRAGQVSTGGRLTVTATGAGGVDNTAAVILGRALAADGIEIRSLGARQGADVGSAVLSGSSSSGRRVEIAAPGAEADVRYGGAAGAALTGAADLALSAGRDVSVEARASASPARSVSVAAGRDIHFNATGDFATPAELRLVAARDVVARSDRGLLVTRIEGRNLSVNAEGALDLSQATAGLDLLAVSNATATLGTVTVGRSLSVRAADLEISGAVAADTVAIESIAAGGVVLGDGSASPSVALRVSQSEFGRVLARQSLSFQTAGSAGGIVVGDLTLDPARTPRLRLSAGPAQDIAISGTVAPSRSGGLIELGDADAARRPARILVSGALGLAPAGTGGRGFDRVVLSATRDVLIGSNRFIGLVAPSDVTVDVARDQPGGVAPTGEEIGRNFVVARRLEISAGERIIQQNTAAEGGRGGVLVFGDGSAASTEDGVLVQGARLVDLFGAFQDAAGAITTNTQTAPGNLTISGAGEASQIVRFNGCQLSGAGACLGAASELREAVRATNFLELIADEEADQREQDDSDGSGAGGVPTPPPVLRYTSPAVEIDPVPLSTGSQEIWRGRVQPGKR